MKRAVATLEYGSPGPLAVLDTAPRPLRHYGVSALAMAPPGGPGR
jgi:hypothetical protein